jgi:hypothetical protein
MLNTYGKSASNPLMVLSCSLLASGNIPIADIKIIKKLISLSDEDLSKPILVAMPVPKKRTTMPTKTMNA